MTKIEQKIIGTIRGALDSYYTQGVESYMRDYARTDVDLSTRDAIVFSPERIAVLYDGKGIVSIHLASTEYYSDKTLSKMNISLARHNNKVIRSRLNAIVGALFSRIEGESYALATRQGVPVLLKRIYDVLDKCTIYESYQLGRTFRYGLSVGCRPFYVDTNQHIKPIATACY